MSLSKLFFNIGTPLTQKFAIGSNPEWVQSNPLLPKPIPLRFVTILSFHLVLRPSNGHSVTGLHTKILMHFLLFPIRVILAVHRN